MCSDPHASSSESGKRSGIGSEDTLELVPGGGPLEKSLLDFIKREVAHLIPTNSGDLDKKDSSSSDEFKENYLGNKRCKSGGGNSPSLR